MRRKLVVGNWKMHGSRAEIHHLVQAISSGISDLNDAMDVAICPTHLHIELAAQLLGTARIKLGAQDAHFESSGAFTGAVAASMLGEYGVNFVLVGHSERRELFGDSNEIVARKFLAIHRLGLQPILCIGETLQQRQQNATAEAVLGQLNAVIMAAGIAAIGDAVLAYEPVWAIGSGQTATPEQAQEVHSLLRQHLAAQSREVADRTRIIYGGSVNGANARQLFDQADIDGGLVGGASLQAAEFISICKSAD